MNKAELNKILNLLKPGLDKTASIESMMYFFFTGKEIVTYNSQVSIQYPLKTKLKCFVNAKNMMAILSKIVSEDIVMELKKDKLNVKAPGVNVNLATIFDSEVVERIEKVNKSISKAKFKSLPDKFQEGSRLCHFAASKVDSDGTLTCIHIKDKIVSASNNKQIAQCKMDKKMDEILIPTSCLKELVEMNPTSYTTSKVWIHFKNTEGCIFSIRKIRGDYPDFSSFFKFKGNDIDLSADIAEGIDIASIFMDEENPSIKVTVEDGSCLISVKGANGTSKHKTSIDYNGEEISFFINPDFLREMMSHSTSVVIDESKAMITSGDFRIITALMQVS